MRASNWQIKQNELDCCDTAPLNACLDSQLVAQFLMQRRKGAKICMCLLEAISGQFEATKIMALLKLT